MRRRAKTINFGLLYGMEAFGLSQRLNISREEAAEHIDAYFSQFPAVKSFMDGMVLEARRNGYTTTLFKRRRYLPELQSDNFRIRQMGERMALNAPCTGDGGRHHQEGDDQIVPATKGRSAPGVPFCFRSTMNWSSRHRSKTFPT